MSISAHRIAHIVFAVVVVVAARPTRRATFVSNYKLEHVGSGGGGGAKDHRGQLAIAGGWFWLALTTLAAAISLT